MEFTLDMPMYQPKTEYMRSLDSLIKSNGGRWKSDKQKSFLDGEFRRSTQPMDGAVPFDPARRRPDGAEYGLWFSGGGQYGSTWNMIYWMDEDGVLARHKVVAPHASRTRERARDRGWETKPPTFTRELGDRRAEADNMINSAQPGDIIPDTGTVGVDSKGRKRRYQWVQFGSDRSVYIDNHGNMLVDRVRSGSPDIHQIIGDGGNLAEHAEEVREAIMQPTFDEQIYALPREEVVAGPGWSPQSGGTQAYVGEDADALAIIDSVGDVVVFDVDKIKRSPHGPHIIIDMLVKNLQRGSTLRDEEPRLLGGLKAMLNGPTTEASFSFDTSTIMHIPKKSGNLSEGM